MNKQNLNQIQTSSSSQSTNNTISSSTSANNNNTTNAATNDHVNNNNNSQNVQIPNELRNETCLRRSLLLVRATHEYLPVNNDELHISPGDTITITNPEDGGWWEGTLNSLKGSKTGWFPSNYVQVIDDPSTTSTAVLQNSITNPEQTSEYKRLIVEELIESELNYIQELEGFFEKLSSRSLNLFSDPIINKLKFCYNSIINSHKTHVLTPLKSEMSENPTKNFRVGKIFLSGAKFLENSHTNYCAQHPKFVQFVERNQNKFENIDGGGSNAGPGGVLKVIMCLSAPFRRIEKYGGILNELESHAEVFCSDKGDLKRGVEYFRELEKTLTSTRKQKEMELEVLIPGVIKELEGPDITTLGEILLMNLMFITGRDKVPVADKQPRYFILFSNTILILYYDNTDSTFTYKGRVYIGGVTVINSIDNLEESSSSGSGTEFVGFQIAGPTLHSITVQCQSKKIRNLWISKLNELIRVTRCYSTPPPLLQNVSCSSSSSSSNSYHPQQQQQQNSNSTSSLSTISPSLHQQQQNQHHHQKVVQQQQQQGFVVGGVGGGCSSNWNIARLRPSPPYNPFLAEYHKMGDGGGGGNNNNGKKGGSSSSRTASGSSFVGSPVFGNNNKTGSFSGFSSSGGRGSGGNLLVTNEDDFAILSIVDGFCVRGGGGGLGVNLRNDPNNRSIRSLDYNINGNNKNRNNTGSGSSFINVSRPPPLPASSSTPPAVFVSSSNNNVNSNKSLPQLVKLLHDDVTILHERIGLLSRQLEEERIARVQLLAAGGGSSNNNNVNSS